MKKSRFSEHQIIRVLKEVEAGRSAKQLHASYLEEPVWRYGGL